ncbi:cell division protein FtsQ/DivIB [Haloimpatiens massiliensis]|uniref:cell division protein FtsQ/DivIB n=1 Tax=Haloimpatiens massiliensis TaxID=1658110 RepID=UPI000C82294D|nr:FtsQ-type POTRA domain-containing protein [Haloimpatiens massiliensis]
MEKNNKNNNVTYLEESKYIIENRDKLIKKRKRKKMAIKLLFLTSLLAIISLTLLLKLPYFSIKDIVVINNSNVTKDEIIKLSGIKKGNNIFSINVRSIKDDILRNPYILKVQIKRRLPNKILIDVNERSAAFYAQKDSNYYIIDKESVVLEKRKNINTMKLIKLVGYEKNNLVIGQVLPYKDQRKAEAVKNITDLVINNTSKMTMSIVDVTNIYDIKVYYGNMCVKMGDYNNLEDKLNRAVAIIKKQNLQKRKGYVDVSFKGNPVFHIEK